MFVNILQLTFSIYMLQVYDKVLTSYNLSTLAVITLAAVICLVVLALLEWIRSRLLVRAGIAFDNRGTGLDSTRALAVPVLSRGTLECVLGCWYPTFRTKGRRGEIIAARCRETAERLSRALENPDCGISPCEKSAASL